jgi:selenocysteine-specific elongation factor
MVLTASDALSPVNMVEGELRLLSSIRGRLGDYAEVHLHLGTLATLARVAMLERDALAPGERQMVQLRFAEAAGIVPGDRFVIRAALPGADQAGLVTIGGGQILSTTNARLRRRRPWTLEHLAARRAALASPVQWAAQVLRESTRPLAIQEISRRCYWSEAEAERCLDALQTSGLVVPTPAQGWVHRDLVRQAASRVQAAVEAFHAANPQRLGIPQADLLSESNDDPRVFSLALASLVAEGRIRQHPGGWSLAGWTVRLASADDDLKERLVSLFRSAAWTPPRPEELAVSVQQPQGRVGKMLLLLVDRGDLVRLADGLFMHREAVASAKKVALDLFARAPSFTTMQFRDALGVSRKYAVPLLDHLDATRFTVRAGNVRTPGVEARRMGGGTGSP